MGFMENLSGDAVKPWTDDKKVISDVIVKSGQVTTLTQQRKSVQ